MDRPALLSSNVLPPPPPPQEDGAAYTVSASSLTMEVDAVSHTCSPLDCFKMWLSAHACRHPHRVNELATNSEKWSGKPRLACANVRHPPSETPVIYFLGMPESREITEQIDWRTKKPITSGLRLGRSEVLRSL